MLHKTLLTLRSKHQLSQDFLAEKIGVSRPTYVQIEKGDRSPTLEELQKMSQLYEMPLQDLIEGREKATPQVTLKKTSSRQQVSVTVPTDKVEKARQVLLYILDKVGAKAHVGETVIYKLLYFMDFDFYEKHQRLFLGLHYIKNHHGPTPVEFKTMVDQMEEDQCLVRVRSKYFQYDQKKYLPLKAPRLTLLTAEEKEHIDETLNRLGNKNATELSSLSHLDMPWIVAEKGQPIEYETVFQRTNETSLCPMEEEEVWEQAAAEDTLAALGPISREEHDYYMNLPDNR